MAVAWRLARASVEVHGPHGKLDEAVYMIRAGRLEEARRVADDALACWNGDPTVAGRAHSFRGEVASIRGDLVETAREYALAVSHLERTELVGSLARARRGRADGLVNLGMYSSALDEVDAARMLVDSIDDPAVRRRAALESALCEGLIRIELNQPARGRVLWESAATLISPESDPLLVGLHDLLGGLALAAEPRDRRPAWSLLDRAADHFAEHGLVYHRARALEAHGRALVADDLAAAIERISEATAIYAKVGASLRFERARRWLEDAEPKAPCVPRSPRRPVPVGADVEGLVVAGPTTRAFVELALGAAASGSTVLVTGESGTGKELVARLIHRRSSRAAGPWVPFNCAAVPAEMVESLLFGHRRGAFTGAMTSHTGLVREAHGGTFFLDEIGELPLGLQAKLLRFLQEREVLPLGEARPVRVDVRIVAATNRDLEREAREGRFREDLYHRLNVIRLRIPPLRERRDEIPVLARRITDAVARRLGLEGASVTAGAIGPLVAYEWPGNVRELGNVVERSLALHGPVVTRESVEESLGLPAPMQTRGDDRPLRLGDAMDQFERAYIERAIAMSNGSKSSAAKLLGVSLQRLRYRMRRLGMG